MGVLFAISVLCLCAVIWVSVSIARIALASRRRPLSRLADGFTEVFFTDKMQQIRGHSDGVRQAPAALHPPSGSAAAPPVPPPAPVAAPLFEHAALRKGPQPAIAGATYRADWDYFNKDLGDLTDPYENIPRSRSEARSGARRY
jgi:hypothetical protein